ncbi:MAG TPA: hypothetical protein VF221_13180 [Chloroflexota bacterium]
MHPSTPNRQSKILTDLGPRRRPGAALLNAVALFDSLASGKARSIDSRGNHESAPAEGYDRQPDQVESDERIRGVLEQGPCGEYAQREQGGGKRCDPQGEDGVILDSPGQARIG